MPSTIIIVTAVFLPEPVVSARTSFDLAKEFHKLGRNVTVVAPFPNRPAGKLFPGYRRRLSQREKMESGVEVIRCFATLSPESRLFSRFLENLSFGLISSWYVLTSRRPEVIYANTWPIIATGILLLAAKLRGVPLVISVQDVYPEALIAQGRIGEFSFPARIMRWIDGAIARHSAHVIVISERFAEIYRHSRRVPAERLSLIPNWIDSQMIDVSISGQAFRELIGVVNDDFLIVYGGNVGVAAGVEMLVEVVGILPKDLPVKLLIAGSGSQLVACQALAEEIGDPRILFHSPWIDSETSEVLRAADLLVLPTQGEQSLVSVPSKLISYMLAGRPVVAQAVPGSDLAQVVSKAKCGWVVDPGNPEALAEMIKEIATLVEEERTQRGLFGRDYALRHLTKSECLPKVITILEKVSLS